MWKTRENPFWKEEEEEERIPVTTFGNAARIILTDPLLPFAFIRICLSLSLCVTPEKYITWAGGRNFFHRDWKTFFFLSPTSVSEKIPPCFSPWSVTPFLPTSGEVKRWGWGGERWRVKWFMAWRINKMGIHRLFFRDRLKITDRIFRKSVSRLSSLPGGRGKKRIIFYRILWSLDLVGVP